MLSLFSTLSHTNRIVFDLVAQDPSGADEYYAIVKEIAKNGGAAILLDWVPDMKNDCSRYIELEWKNGYIPAPPTKFEAKKVSINTPK